MILTSQTEYNITLITKHRYTAIIEQWNLAYSNQKQCYRALLCIANGSCSWKFSDFNTVKHLSGRV